MIEYDPREVPILAELEQEFGRMVADALTPASAAGAAEAADAADARRAGLPRGAAVPRPRAPWLSTGRRILGRAVTAGALVGVVGATALATKSVVSHDGAAARPVVLERAAGHALTLRRYQGRLCLDVSSAAAVASRCVAAPAAGGVAPLSAETAGGRVVAGLAGSGVARVRVETGGGAAEVATRAVDGALGARDLRWFSALLPAAPRGRPAAALVAPRRASGAPAGVAVADCTLGTVASCRAVRASATPGRRRSP